MRPVFNVQNKIALVTGANRGIGKAITQALIEHGISKVYAGVRNLDNANELQQEYGSLIEPVLIDLNDPQTIIAASQRASDVDIVINNAGVLTTTQILDPQVTQALQFEFEVNVLGLIYMAQAFTPVLRQRQVAAFVQINSIASVRTSSFIATYSATKAAAYSVSQSLMHELIDDNIAVVSVHPGPIETDMATQAGISDIAEPAGLVADAIIEALATGQFHVFPDTMAQNIYEKYQSFAQSVIEKDFKA